jgi:alkanesulfonate monooxygenase SsuD/methylene tetrahydromethanopterin reductase-like flavin-dependent oxidoreductase (luciferase family)
VRSPLRSRRWRAPELVHFVTEGRGFSRVYVRMPDHLGDQLAPIVALAAGFGMTRRLRMGALVACNDFRLPFVYEKKLATLDVM